MWRPTIPFLAASRQSGPHLGPLAGDHGDGSMPKSILDAILTPFAVSVSDVLQMSKLAYSYDDFPILKTQP